MLEVADATVAGTLDDEGGAAVAGAHLSIVGGTGDGRHAISATDGTFAIDMLPAGALRLHVEHPDYPPEDFAAVASSGAREPARLKLPIGGAVEGALIDDASGAPIASVTIAGTGPRGASAEATTDQGGPSGKLGRCASRHWKIAVKLPELLAGDA